MTEQPIAAWGPMLALRCPDEYLDGHENPWIHVNVAHIAMVLPGQARKPAGTWEHPADRCKLVLSVTSGQLRTKHSPVVGAQLVGDLGGMTIEVHHSMPDVLRAIAEAWRVKA